MLRFSQKRQLALAQAGSKAFRRFIGQQLERAFLGIPACLRSGQETACLVEELMKTNSKVLNLVITDTHRRFKRRDRPEEHERVMERG
ncbi:hypothetical protein DPEC_G00358930 [Dallia pectoralis]|uniref:Uncharacterized protein n=1 Tax=Dallia pectoralis TaxID=75939 RepID=A0ACC2F0C4_DALPE|nr:hypothetical protein DPEC_G00358930 [Dallia pectoralis]